MASLGVSPPAYMFGILGLSLGLTWTYCLVAAFVAALLSALVAAATIHPSSKYGVPVCVAARAAFGVWGSKVFSLLFLALALPWTAWLLMVAAEGLSVGIARFRPATASWAPIPPDLLPGGYSNLLSVLCLAVAAVVLWTWYMLGKVHSVRRLAPTCTTTVLAFYIGMAIWGCRLVGFPTALAGYDRLRSQENAGALPLYVALPLAVLAGVGCWTTPLLLGFGDLARWCSVRAAPRDALLYAFPLFATASCFLGVLVTGAVEKGWTSEAMTPTAPLRFLSPPSMALAGGVLLCLGALHAALAGYVLAAGHALTDVVGPRFLHNSTVAGGVFILGSLALALFCPQALLESGDVRAGTGPLSLMAWSIVSGLVGGAVVGVLLADYWWMRKAALPVDYMYKTAPRLHAWGINSGALFALVLAFVVFAIRNVVRAAVPWSSSSNGGATPELLSAMCFATTFPVSFVAYAMTFNCFTAAPAAPVAATAGRETGRNSGGSGDAVNARTAAATAAGATNTSYSETYPTRSNRRTPLPPRPVPSQQSASSRATEQLTATLHQLLLAPPPTAPPASASGALHEAPVDSQHHVVFEPSAPKWGVGGAGSGDEETKMEGLGGSGGARGGMGMIPHAYAVTVYSGHEEEEEGGRGAAHR